MQAERELCYPAAVQVVILVEGPVGVPSLMNSLDDVVPHRQHTAVAAAVADEALAAGPGHDDSIVEEPGVRHRTIPVTAPSRHQECRVGQR